jgi:hypothetical protein
MNRRVLACALAVASVALTAPGASAKGAPERGPLLNESFDFAAGEGCAFPVHFEVVSDNESYTAFPSDADGTSRTLVTGKLAYDITNTATGLTVHREASGPGTFTDHPDGTTDLSFQGTWVFYFGPDDSPTGPALQVRTGSGTAHYDGTGWTYSFRGKPGEDLCRTLA